MARQRAVGQKRHSGTCMRNPMDMHLTPWFSRGIRRLSGQHAAGSAGCDKGPGIHCGEVLPTWPSVRLARQVHEAGHRGALDVSIQQAHRQRAISS